MPCKLFEASFTACCAASSQLVLELAKISMTLTIAIAIIFILENKSQLSGEEG
jgi:hypothetical protein